MRLSSLNLFKQFERQFKPQRKKIYLRTSVLREDSDQPSNAVPLELSLRALRIAKDPSFCQADSNDTDQIARIRRLI